MGNAERQAVSVAMGPRRRVGYAGYVTKNFMNMKMNKTPPFDPPYKTITRTIDGARVLETLADGVERVITSQAIIPGRAVSSRPATPVRKAVNPVVHGNVEAILFLDVPFAEKDSVKRLGAKWDGVMRKWYIPHGMDVHQFSRWCTEALQLQMQSVGQI